MFSFWVHSAELLWRNDIHVVFRWMKTSQHLTIDPPLLCSRYLDLYDKGNRSILQLRNGADSCTPLYFTQRGTYTWNTIQGLLLHCFSIRCRAAVHLNVRTRRRSSCLTRSSGTTLWHTFSFKCFHLRCAASKNYIVTCRVVPVTE
jgi:hypothetical protein